MPRGVKKIINYDDELMRIDMRITKYRNEIAELQEKRQALETEKRQMEIGTLYDAVKASGKSIEEVMSALGLEKPSDMPIAQ